MTFLSDYSAVHLTGVSFEKPKAEITSLLERFEYDADASSVRLRHTDEPSAIITSNDPTFAKTFFKKLNDFTSTPAGS